MKDIVFINPPVDLNERYGGLAGAGSTMPSLGLATLAAVCRKNGFNAAIVEAGSGRLTDDKIVEAVAGNGARYAGITAMTSSINRAALLALKIKKMVPGITTLIGGPHVTALPEETMRLFPAFDVGFIGEGEETLVDYLKSIDGNADIARVKGIVFRAGDQLLKTGKRPFIEDLDTLPMPAWDLVPGFPGRYAPAAIRCRKLPAAHIVTSRGCPMTCTFCDRSVFGTRYRLFSVDYIWEMLRLLTGAFGVRDILFEDDSFTLHKNRVLSLCERICSTNSRFSWSCLGRVDTIDSELLSAMKRAGCWQIGFGIESGNAKVLDGVRKKINLDRIREALALTRAAGIHTKGFFILGLPGESTDTMRETMRLALSAALDDISVSFATPFPGTVFYGQAMAQGDYSPDWPRMNLLNAVYVPEALSKSELEDRHAEFIRCFYFRPRIFVDYFLRCLVDAKVFVRLARGLFMMMAMVFKKKRLRS